MVAQKIRLFQDTVVRLDAQGIFWIMNRAESGWNCQGRNYSTLKEITDLYDVRIGSFGQDQHSIFFHVHVQPR